VRCCFGGTERGGGVVDAGCGECYGEAVKTADLGGNSRTVEVTEAVCGEIERLARKGGRFRGCFIPLERFAPLTIRNNYYHI